MQSSQVWNLEDIEHMNELAGCLDGDGEDIDEEAILASDDGTWCEHTGPFDRAHYDVQYLPAFAEVNIFPIVILLSCLILT